MTVFLVSIEDSMSGFSQPRQAVSVAAALRDFSDAVNDTKLLSRHAGDFALWQIATFDPETGDVVPSKVLLSRASDFLRGDVDG